MVGRTPHILWSHPSVGAPDYHSQCHAPTPVSRTWSKAAALVVREEYLQEIRGKASKNAGKQHKITSSGSLLGHVGRRAQGR